MSGGNLRILVCVLCLAGSAARGAPGVHPATARRAVTQAPVVAVDAEFAELARAGQPSEIAVRLDRIAANPALDAIAREWLLGQGLHELARLTPTPGARVTVSRLALRAP